MRREKIILIIALLVVAGATAISAVVSQSRSHKAASTPSPTPIMTYDQAQKKADSLVAAKQYGPAVLVWKSFLNQPPASSDLRKAYDQLAAVYDLQKDYAAEVRAYMSATEAPGTATFYEEYYLGNAAMNEFFALAGKPGYDKSQAKGYVDIANTAYTAAIPLAPDSAMTKQTKDRQGAAAATLSHLQ